MSSSKQIKAEIWPNFFIVGAAKAGTTSLYHYISQVPGVCMSQVKEPHFFTSKVGPRSKYFLYVGNKDEYLKLFSQAKDSVAIGEASPSYLYDVSAPNKIKALLPNAKIIILLRDPIKRAFSQFIMETRYGMESNLSFYDALLEDYEQKEKGWWFSHLYVELGLYYEQVKRYLDLFGSNNVKILIFEEEFTQNTKLAVDDVVKFLGLQYEIPESVVKLAYNSRPSQTFSVPRSKMSWKLMEIIGKLRNKNMTIYRLSKLVPSSVQEDIADILFTRRSQKPVMPKEAAQFLENIYCEDVSKLSKLLGRPLPWLT